VAWHGTRRRRPSCSQKQAPARATRQPIDLLSNQRSIGPNRSHPQFHARLCLHLAPTGALDRTRRVCGVVGARCNERAHTKSCGLGHVQRMRRDQRGEEGGRLQTTFQEEEASETHRSKNTHVDPIDSIDHHCLAWLVAAAAAAAAAVALLLDPLFTLHSSATARFGQVCVASRLAWAASWASLLSFTRASRK
jgi:hypothetical protein